MDRYAEPPFADLPPRLVEKLRNLETELSRELAEPVVLLAYEDVPGANSTGESQLNLGSPEQSESDSSGSF